MKLDFFSRTLINCKTQRLCNETNCFSSIHPRLSFVSRVNRNLRLGGANASKILSGFCTNEQLLLREIRLLKLQTFFSLSFSALLSIIKSASLAIVLALVLFKRNTCIHYYNNNSKTYYPWLTMKALT